MDAYARNSPNRSLGMIIILYYFLYRLVYLLQGSQVVTDLVNMSYRVRYLTVDGLKLELLATTITSYRWLCNNEEGT